MNPQHLLARIALRFLRPILIGFQHRMPWWSLGLFPVRSSVQPHMLSIAGQTVMLRFPVGEEDRQLWELRHLHCDDPYLLQQMPTKLVYVVDIGGNIGLFSMLARARFAAASIHCYEPNPALQEILNHNLMGLGITVHAEGVSDRAGTGNMDCGGASLEGSLQETQGAGGGIRIVSLHEVVARIGGTVDLLKMDCEGAEWNILADLSGFQHIKRIAMEYHLDGSTERTVPILISRLHLAGYRIEALRESTNPLVGQLFAVRP